MWYMHRTENPANEVQLLESPLKNIGMTITEHEDEIIYKLKLDNGQSPLLLHIKNNLKIIGKTFGSFNYFSYLCNIK